MADATKVDFYFYYHSNHLGSTNFVTRVAKSEDEDKPRHAMYEHVEYIPFGETWVEEREKMPFGGQKSNSYLFTSKELDLYTGFYYFKARYYNPRTSTWLSADPALEKYLPTFPSNEAEQEKLSTNPIGYWAKKLYGEGGVYNSPNLNLYSYTVQNPLKYIDPTGEVIKAKDKHERKQIEGYINSRAKGVFRFNEKGELKLLKKDKENKKGSAYYRDQLVKAINSEDTITIDIAKNYKWKGRDWNTDIDDGGGATIGGNPFAIRIFGLGKSGGDQKVIISGNPNKDLKDKMGRPLIVTPADILVHELVGHAIPKIGFSDTGDAIRNENKVRKQNNLPLRRKPRFIHREW